MNTGCVHLIVACTRRKTVSAGDIVFPYEHDAGNAYEVWLERLARARNDSAAITGHFGYRNFLYVKRII